MQFSAVAREDDTSICPELQATRLAWPAFNARARFNHEISSFFQFTTRFAWRIICTFG